MKIHSPCGTSCKGIFEMKHFLAISVVLLLGCDATQSRAPNADDRAFWEKHHQRCRDRINELARKGLLFDDSYDAARDPLLVDCERVAALEETFDPDWYYSHGETNR